MSNKVTLLQQFYSTYVALVVIFEKTFENLNYGIRIGGEARGNAAYAGDAALITHTCTEMNTILDQLHINSRSFCLKINILKTKVMFIGNHPDNAVCNIDGQKLEKVTSFRYLGRIITNNGDETEPVDNFISKAWNAYSKVKSMITKKKKRRPYILPCLIYATETVTWKEALIKKVELFQNNIMWISTNKRKIDKISIENLMNMTKFTSISTIIKHRKLRCFGHLKRSVLPVKTIHEGMTPGKRKGGRPNKMA